MSREINPICGASGPAAWLWIALTVLASIALSRAFACAMPFAALATVAAFTLRGREALVLVLFAWFANQAVGFGLMHYPWTASTFCWGVAIGIAALASLASARAAAAARAIGTGGRLVLALAGGYAAYELVLFSATWVLPSGPGAFAATVVLRILAINAVALALLLCADRLVGPTAWSRRASLPGDAETHPRLVSR